MSRFLPRKQRAVPQKNIFLFRMVNSSIHICPIHTYTYTYSFSCSGQLLIFLAIRNIWRLIFSVHQPIMCFLLRLSFYESWSSSGTKIFGGKSCNVCGLKDKIVIHYGWKAMSMPTSPRHVLIHLFSRRSIQEALLIFSHCWVLNCSVNGCI